MYLRKKVKTELIIAELDRNEELIYGVLKKFKWKIQFKNFK